MNSGLILIDKAIGQRCTDCVSFIKKSFAQYGKIRVGHAGTLDSTACGLLIVLTGIATRLSDYIMQLPKRYLATIQLGTETDTADSSGNVVWSGDISHISEQLLDMTITSFLGWRMQQPPQISAVKIGGTASHKIARKGINVEPLSRPVKILSIRRTSVLTKLSPSSIQFSLEIECGKGTYIRSIARDLGRRLNCGAHISFLRRISVGNFCVDDASAISDISKTSVIDAGKVFEQYHGFDLTSDSEYRLQHGLDVWFHTVGKYRCGTNCPENFAAVSGEKMIGFADIDFSGDDGIARLRPRVNMIRTEGSHS